MINYKVKYFANVGWVVAYSHLTCKNGQYYEQWTIAGQAHSATEAEQLRQKLIAESKARHQKMVAELKALDRGYRG